MLISWLFWVFTIVFCSRNYWSNLNHHLIAIFFRKSHFNLNLGHSYLITTVLLATSCSAEYQFRADKAHFTQKRGGWEVQRKKSCKIHSIKVYQWDLITGKTFPWSSWCHVTPGGTKKLTRSKITWHQEAHGQVFPIRRDKNLTRSKKDLEKKFFWSYCFFFLNFLYFLKSCWTVWPIILEINVHNLWPCVHQRVCQNRIVFKHSWLRHSCLKTNSNTSAEACVASGRDGKPYPHSCCSWKVTLLGTGIPSAFIISCFLGKIACRHHSRCIFMSGDRYRDPRLLKLDVIS